MRKAVVAGKFYPSSPDRLQKEISELVDTSANKLPALGMISPHAGYVYSGAVAGATFSKIEMPESFIIIGPNHRGAGEAVSISSKEDWEMPGGAVKINMALAEILKSKTAIIKEDPQGHLFEHSLEVQLPFIQHLLKEFEIVPISLRQANYSDCEEIGTAIALSVKEYGKPVLVIASSDMTHYESKESAERKDRLALDKLIKLDPNGLYTTVCENSISMCGYIPATIMLIACKELGAVRAELVKYMTSGDVSGDYEQVVGYAGVIVY